MPVRLRITVLASSVVALSLLGGGWLFVRALHVSRIDELDRDANARTDSVVETVRSGQARTPLPAARDSSLLVQVIDQDGVVAASTANVMDMHDPFIDPVRYRPQAGSPSVWAATVDGAAVRLSGRAVSVSGRRYAVYVAAPLTGVEESMSMLRRQLLRISPFVLLGTALVLYVVVGRALRPVDVLQREVEAIEPADLQRRVSVPMVDDEVSRLARTMNALLGRLQDASDRQQRFVSDASHELRTPLAVVRTKLEVGLRRPDSTDWPATADAVLEQSRRMERLVSELLILVRAERSVGMSSMDVDLEDVVRSAVADARAWRSSPEIGLSQLLAGRVNGDPDRLRRVVSNLLDNAMLHARSRVELALRSEDGRVILTVDDDGPGIEPQDRQRVFERFTRLDDSRDRTSGGAGLGLAIVRELVTAHRGTVRALESPLGGARFLVDLPEV